MGKITLKSLVKIEKINGRANKPTSYFTVDLSGFMAYTPVCMVNVIFNFNLVNSIDCF